MAYPCKKNSKCKAQYEKYKKICANVWDKRCTQDLPTTTLVKYADYALKCLDNRAIFTEKCCYGNYDEGHAGALLKMEKMYNYCKKEFNKRLHVPELYYSY